MKLNLNNLTKSFGDLVVLDRVTREIEDFDSLVLIGPSGGGKTTLLRLIAGLEVPTSGSISINDKEIEFTEKALYEYRKRIGMVYQAYNLFPHLNAIENIMLPLTKVHNIPENEAKEQTMELLERFNLADHGRKRPIALSGGQQQRIAICRAVAIKPEFLLFDEPTSALDPEFTSEVLDLMLELREEGMRQIVVTHEMGFAKEASDRVAFISDGGIVACERPEIILGKPEDIRVQSFLNKVLKHH